MIGIATGARLQPNADLQANLDLIASTGAQAVRFTVGWNAVEPVLGGGYTFGHADELLDAVHARALKVCLTIGGRGDDRLLDADHIGPFGEFAAAVALRYQDPTLILGYEGPNEIMLGTKYDTNPTPARYVPLQAALYAACKSATDLPVGTSAIIGHQDWLTEIYAAGARDHFDYVAWHPYTRPLSPSQSIHNHAGGWWSMMQGRHVMVANGDGHKQIWVTEFGSNTAGRDARTEQQQATDLFDAHERFRKHEWAGPFFWFTGRDASPLTNDPGDSMGLFHADGTPKTAVQTFQRLGALEAA